MKTDPTEIVDLLIVMPYNVVWAHGLTRLKASGIIREWWSMREAVRKLRPGATIDPIEGVPDESVWTYEGAAERLHYGTFAMNYNEPGEESLADWAIAWEQVIGMYIKERATTMERYAAVQEKAIKIMEEEMKERKKGDEWKADDE